MNLTVHIDLPTDIPAEAWHVAALVAGAVEDYFQLEVDEPDIAVTDAADWSQPVEDDVNTWRPVETVPVAGGIL